MRRRVVCPRSHPASPYLRRPLADFALARSVFFRGDTPRTPGRPPPAGASLRTPETPVAPRPRGPPDSRTTLSRLMPTGPRTPGPPPVDLCLRGLVSGGRGAGYLRRLAGVGTCGVVSSAGGLAACCCRVSLPGAAGRPGRAGCGGLGGARGDPGRGSEAGRARVAEYGQAGFLGPWRGAVPGRVLSASLSNTEPGVTTRSGHFRSAKPRAF